MKYRTGKILNKTISCFSKKINKIDNPKKKLAISSQTNQEKNDKRHISPTLEMKEGSWPLSPQTFKR